MEAHLPQKKYSRCTTYFRRLSLFIDTEVEVTIRCALANNSVRHVIALCKSSASAPRPPYIWLARDEHLSKYVAIRFAISGLDRPVESTVMRVLHGERNDTKPHAGIEMIPEVIGESEEEGLEIEGTRGKHRCLDNTPARMNVSDAREAGTRRLFQLDVARALAAQLIQAVAFMQSRGVIHGGK
jgi:hypothetical protein